VVNVGDVHSATDYVQDWDLAQSELAIPLKIGSEVIGVIDVQSAQPDAFSPNDVRLMTIFAERAALALEHSRMYEQTKSRVQQLAALRTIDMAISSSFDLKLTLGILLNQLTAQLGVHAADVLVFNPVTQTFGYSNGHGFRTHALQHTRLRLGEGLAGKAALERRVLKVPDLRAEPSGFGKSPLILGENFVAYVGVPLIVKGQVKGVLEVFQREPLDFNSEEQAFLEILAGQAAIAIDIAELFDNLQSSVADLKNAYDSTLEGWASALELRDKETEGHTRRVTDLTIQLAQALGVKENELVQIYRGALLHDIGKIGVPDSIVLKPGPLTEEEWDIMRKHPIYAYDMLLPISYLHDALNIPYCHHEKWDGTGYPRGLKGEEIPLAARIFSVVDAWDALTSDRPYRKTWSHEKAKEYIYEQAGKQFDPRVVEIFLGEVVHA
jgi:HD-GYP domain-containing protein (c-di-GMP phosphodiesterase class II)